MQGILVYKFPPDTPSTVRDRFLIALGKLFDSCIPFTESAVFLRTNQITDNVATIAANLTQEHGAEIVLSLHTEKTDIEQHLAVTATLG